MKLVLKNVRASHLHVFEARDYKGDGNFKFSGNFLVPKTDAKMLKLVQDAIHAAAVEAYGVKAEAMVKKLSADKTTNCFRDGDLSDHEGFMVLTAKSTGRPLVIDRDTSPLVAADNKPYSGCYVVAVLDIYCQKEPAGIRCGLKGVQFYREGERFGGNAPASLNDFEDLSAFEDTTDEDSLA